MNTVSGPADFSGVSRTAAPPLSSSSLQGILDALWISAETDCAQADSPVAESKLRLAEITNRFAVALSLDNVPGGVQLESSGTVMDVSTARVLGHVAQVSLVSRAPTCVLRRPSIRPSLPAVDTI